MVERERFVPKRTGELTRDLAATDWEDPADPERFLALGRLVAALYHYEFHDREQAILDAWEAAADDPMAASAVTAELTGLLDGANYRAVTMAELDEALAQEALLPLRLEVDLDDYDEVLIYRRGGDSRMVTTSSFGGLRKRDHKITVDERVVVHTRVKPQAWFDDIGVDPADRNLSPGDSSLKLFQNVPRADIEMLLPSTQVRFRPIDTVMMGVPALASGIAVLATKLAPTLGLIALVVAAGLGLRDESPTLDQTALLLILGGALTLGGFLFRQWTKLKNRRVEYLKTLSETLYFRTLADGPGVFHTLLASAEQQEVIEVLLAYRFLLRRPGGVTAAELDAAIERWLAESCQRDIDFEVDDALAKLRRLGAVGGGRRLVPMPLPEVLAALDRRWDDLFRFRSDEADAPPDGVAGAEAGNGREPGPQRGRLIRLRRVVDRFAGRLGQRRLSRDPAG